MVRTITQIAGDFGLNQNAASDPFAASEASTMELVKKTLNEISSQNDAIMASKGMARSSFTEGIKTQQQTDVLNNVFSSFAQARQTEDLAKSAWQRDIISTGVQADTSKDVTAANIAATTAATKDINQQQTDLQKTLNEQNANYQKELSQLSARQTQEQTKLQANLQSTEADKNLTRSITLNTAETDNQIKAINQQYANEKKLITDRLAATKAEYGYATDYAIEKMDKELELQRQNSLVDFIWQAAATELFKLVGMTSGNEDLTTTLDDTFKTVFSNGQ